MAAGVCHTDALAMEGDMPFPSPGVLGHEGAGVAAAVGPGGDFRVCRGQGGDRLAVVRVVPELPGGAAAVLPFARAARDRGSRPDGSTAPPAPTGRRCTATSSANSSFAGDSVCAANALVPVPADTDVSILGPLACGIGTGAGAVLNALRPFTGSSIVIYGAGAVGLSAVMAARLTGATSIIAVDRSRLGRWRARWAPPRRSTCRPRAPTRWPRCTRLRRRLSDFAMDCAGAVAVLQQAASSVGMRGTVALIGGAPAGVVLARPHVHAVGQAGRRHPRRRRAVGVADRRADRAQQAGPVPVRQADHVVPAGPGEPRPGGVAGLAT